MATHAHTIPAPASAPSIPSRRHLIAGIGAATLASAGLIVAVPTNDAPADDIPVSPDAELIAMCDEYARLEADYGRLCWADDDTDDRPGRLEALAELRAVWARQAELEDPIIMADARTVEGLRARARAVVAYYGQNRTPRGPADSFMWSIVCDLVDGNVA